MSDFSYKGDTLTNAEIPLRPSPGVVLTADQTEQSSPYRLLIGDSIAFTSRGRTVLEIGRSPEEAYSQSVILPTQRGWKILALPRETGDTYTVTVTIPSGPGVEQVSTFGFPLSDFSPGNSLLIIINSLSIEVDYEGELGPDFLNKILAELNASGEVTATGLFLAGALSFTLTAVDEDEVQAIVATRQRAVPADVTAREEYMLVLKFPWTPRLAIPGTPARTVGLNSITPDECGWLSCWTWARNLQTRIIIYNRDQNVSHDSAWFQVAGPDYKFTERVCLLPPETAVGEYNEISIFYRISTFRQDGALNGINVWEPHLTATKTP